MDLALYFDRSSVESGALISTRRTLDGAEKCALRHLRRELVTRGLYFIVVWFGYGGLGLGEEGE